MGEQQEDTALYPLPQQDSLDVETGLSHHAATSSRPRRSNTPNRGLPARLRSRCYMHLSCAFPGPRPCSTRAPDGHSAPLTRSRGVPTLPNGRPHHVPFRSSSEPSRNRNAETRKMNPGLRSWLPTPAFLETCSLEAVGETRPHGPRSSPLLWKCLYPTFAEKGLVCRTLLGSRDERKMFLSQLAVRYLFIINTPYF